MMVAVRKATIEDSDWLIDQLRAFDISLGNKRLLIENETEARACLTGIIESHVILIAYVGVVRSGFIAGTLASHPFNARICVLSEAFWWVVPLYRGTPVAFHLLREFESIGRKVADWIIFSLEYDSQVRDQHLTKRGFRQIERAYLLEV